MDEPKKLSDLRDGKRLRIKKEMPKLVAENPPTANSNTEPTYQDYEKVTYLRKSKKNRKHKG